MHLTKTWSEWQQIADRLALTPFSLTRHHLVYRIDQALHEAQTTTTFGLDLDANERHLLTKLDDEEWFLVDPEF